MVHVPTRPVALEPAQADLLERIVAGPLLDVDTLRKDGALAGAPAQKRQKTVDPNQASLL